MKKDIYRTRLKVSLDKKVLNFLSSLKDDLWIAEEDIMGTEVHNIMLYEQNILNKNEIKKILTSLERIKEKLINNQLEMDEGFEDIHPFFEKCVIDDIGIEIGGKIHTGRSRNDQVSVDMRLKIRSSLNKLSKDLFKLIDVLFNLSEKTINSFVPLYTHLQRGQLGVLSHYLNNYIAQILRSLERIEEIYKRINTNPLGACAIGGTSINIDRKRTTELFGFEGIVENSLDAISSKDYIFETLACLSLISMQFSRIAEDLLIWFSKEFSFIDLDERYCSVSSVMPQKKNPDTLELIRSKSSKTISELFTASMIIKSIPSGYFRDFQDLKPLLMKSFHRVFSTIEMFIGIFSTLRINNDKMIGAVNDSFILALDLAEFLVRDYNIPFRKSHEIVAKLVRCSQDFQEILNKERIKNAIFNVEGVSVDITDEFIKSLNDLNSCLEQRTSLGSPSKIEIKKFYDSILKKKIKLYDKYQKRVKHVENSKTSIEHLISNLKS